MKIIYYSPHPTHDIVSEVGYATHQRETIIALEKLGHQVCPVIMGGTSRETLNPLTSGSIKPSPVKRLLKTVLPRFMWTTLNNYKLRRHDKVAAGRLEQAVQQFKPDLIYERSEYLQDSGTNIAKAYGIRYFLEVNAPFVEEMRHFEGYSLYHPLAHSIEKKKLKAADRVFVVSGILGEFLAERYNCDPEKIILSPNCINPEKLNINTAQVLETTAAHNLSGKTVVGFVGSIFPHHGLDILVKAFDAVAAIHDNIVLMIVGDGSVLPEIKSLALSLPSGDRMIFTGKVPHDDVFTYISCMDICVMAKSNWYGSPVKIFEYGALEKPVIAPDNGPVRDVMDNGVHGLLVPMEASEVAAAIDTLISDKVLAGVLANNFRNLILEQYTWEHAARLIVKECA